MPVTPITTREVSKPNADAAQRWSRLPQDDSFELASPLLHSAIGPLVLGFVPPRNTVAVCKPWEMWRRSFAVREPHFARLREIDTPSELVLAHALLRSLERADWPANPDCTHGACRAAVAVLASSVPSPVAVAAARLLMHLVATQR